jgi:hypothetical protein
MGDMSQNQGMGQVRKLCHDLGKRNGPEPGKGKEGWTERNDATKYTESTEFGT